MSEEHKSWTEEFKVSGEELLRETEKLIQEGNVTHLVVKNEAGHTIAEFPITVGIIGAILVPILAAIAAIAVYASHFTIVVTHQGPPPPPVVVEPTVVIVPPSVVEVQTAHVDPTVAETPTVSETPTVNEPANGNEAPKDDPSQVAE